MGAQGMEGRFDDVDFLVAQVTGFAGMRVEPAHGNARLGDAELVDEIGMQDAQHGGEFIASEGARDFRKRQMCRRQRHIQAAPRQHHDHFGRA